MRPIDADALIEDLEYDIELDQRALDDDIDHSHREITQFDKDCKQNAVYMLRKAPTVEAVPVRHGEWVGCTNEESVDYECKCFVCGYTVFDDFARNYKYCPNCGARMWKE